MPLKLIDLSVPLDNSPVEPEPARIKYLDHKQGANLLGLASLISSKSIFSTLKNLVLYFLGISKITARNFPDGIGLAWEEIKADTHTGTHLDAPYHFGPVSEGKLSKTIDKIPLEWCYGDGVVLDFRNKLPGEFINMVEIDQALQKINYKLKQGDILLLMTGADKYWGKKNYFFSHAGLTRDATLWIVKQGVKIIGTDGYGLDRPFKNMLNDYLREKDNSCLWPAHFAGRVKEYCHIEKMANLDKIPKPFGFKVICFPIKIRKASAGWVRPVAIIEE
jgi:kynurenine formamidase